MGVCVVGSAQLSDGECPKEVALPSVTAEFTAGLLGLLSLLRPCRFSAHNGKREADGDGSESCAFGFSVDWLSYEYSCVRGGLWSNRRMETNSGCIQLLISAMLSGPYPRVSFLFGPSEFREELVLEGCWVLGKTNTDCMKLCMCAFFCLLKKKDVFISCERPS